MQLITSKAEPSNVGIHNLMIALIVARKDIEFPKKVLKILKLVCFQIQESKIQKSEL